MKNNHGFTLVEILASIFIIFLVGMFFFQFFITAQKTTVDNENKLVAVNLAKSVMEEIKATKGYKETKIEQLNYYYGCQEQSPTADCSEITEEINGRVYTIVFIAREHDENHCELGLYPVEVKIYLHDNKPITTLEGLVTFGDD